MHLIINTFLTFKKDINNNQREPYVSRNSSPQPKSSDLLFLFFVFVVLVAVAYVFLVIFELAGCLFYMLA